MSIMTNADINKVTPSEDVLNDKPDRPSLVELRNGKLVFKQKSLSFEKMSETMQEIVKFREMLEERLASQQPPLSAIPDEHRPVIAKLVHESDKTLQALSKHIQQELSPAIDEDEDEGSNMPTILPLETVEEAIKSVANRVNYGLDAPAEGGKVPAAWLIWRWEVLDVRRDWLPKTAREKVDNRFRERQQVKIDVRALFDSLPEEERTNILGGKSSAKPPAVKAKNGTKGISGTIVIDLSDPTPNATAALPVPSKMASENHVPELIEIEENAPETSEKKPVGRPRKPADPDKAAKEKERLEKKAAKAEREKKAQEAQAKSRSIMANFFGKAKPSGIASPSNSKATKEREASSPGPATMQSDFQRTFRPFALKKDAELAPENWFRERRRRQKPRRHVSRTEGNVIVIDDDEEADRTMVAEPVDVEMVDAEEASAERPLSTILASLPPGLNPPRRPRQPTGYKTYNPVTVRGMMSQLTEAEVAGDDSEVRRLLALLRDRQAVPVKVLSFHEDPRPGYFGTFTRNSREIGPRAPFAKDPVQVDYTYDSGEEWAEEDAGDADDVVEDAEDEGDGDDEPDSDLDSWLVDDDDIEDPGTPIEDRLGSPAFPDIELPPPGKRKAKEDKEKSGAGKKRRVVVPLVPFAKGPEWETHIGGCAYEPFRSYCIQLFNDTPFPIDPFKFVSEPVEQQASGSGQSHQQTEDGFVIPALPPHLAKSLPNPISGLLTPSSSSSTSLTASPGPNAKRGVPAPKTAFPDAHLTHLLTRIGELETSSLQCIVETVHRELQAHKVKKNAIEAKVREVGEKCKEKKVWVVKADVKAQYGLS
ncbi:hypothetical protein L227DRAFT_606090 [Lentinus tigrinus ALCF2SS1-6]|uniref:Chromatin assembly factor 1 subunit A dimerization domain-containing protein n=2 Tax=Lentinus tigrinus TaxID=5365 RepID=A0A5C2SQ10_9APHY|nr:hypothetical protein L227DRAFT_606090 [Lentinus tigrinus ALCF2SS1-6]